MAVKIIDTDNGYWQWIRNVRELKGLTAKVGIQGAKAAEKHEDDPLTNAEIAAVHEFSSPTDKPPGRPFIRPPYDNNPQHWEKRLKEELKRVLEEDAVPAQALMVVAEELRTAMIDRMNAGLQPPLSERTIARRNPGGAAKREKLAAKGRLDDKPLLDTGTLRGAITAVVEKKGV